MNDRSTTRKMAFSRSRADADFEGRRWFIDYFAWRQKSASIQLTHSRSKGVTYSRNVGTESVYFQSRHSCIV